MEKPSVVNISIKELRKRGYANIQEWLRDPKHLYVGRKCHYVGIKNDSIWCNPFKIIDNDENSRNEIINKYRTYLESNRELMDKLPTLLDITELGCWCVPKPCHADILAEMIYTSKKSKESVKKKST